MNIEIGIVIEYFCNPNFVRLSEELVCLKERSRSAYKIYICFFLAKDNEFECLSTAYLILIKRNRPALALCRLFSNTRRLVHKF